MLWVLAGVAIAALGFAYLKLWRRIDDAERSIRHLSAGEDRREDRDALNRVKQKNE